MSTPVRYHCPRRETVVTVERESYLADKCVTPYPLEGWTYVAAEEFVAPDGDAESARDDVESADGVRFVCGDSAGVEWDGEGCGEPFYLSFVRFERGEEVEPVPESEYVEIAGPCPSGPARPRGPPGPG